MGDDLRDMIEMSRTAGADNRLVQAGGGNTSVKTDGGRRMYVKASGTSLAEMREGRGYRTVNVRQCLEMLEDDGLRSLEPVPREQEVARRLKDACVDDLPGRPSVETSLHALLGRCVLHTHPSVVNGLLCARNGRGALGELFGELDPPCLYVPYVDPGFPLAVRLAREIRRYREEHGRLPQVTFLENHGLFASADGPEEALELTRHVFGRIESEWQERRSRRDIRSMPPPGKRMRTIRQIAAAMRRCYAELFDGPVLVRFSENNPVKTFLIQPDARELVQVNSLMPDQVVYCNDMPLWLEHCRQRDDCAEATEQLVRSAAAGMDTPCCIVADGLGLFVAGADVGALDAATATMEATLETLSVAGCFGKPRGMTDGAVEYIRNWEVEKFRRKVMSSAARGGELAGRVAVVTAAGSPPGRAVIRELARRGMHVVTADVQIDVARRAVREMEQEDLPGTGFPVRADVGSEEEVEKLFDWVVKHLGGLDLLVNCAAAPAPGSLVDCPTSGWLRSLNVDVTGYFLLARQAARTMKCQGTGGCIINVTSMDSPPGADDIHCWSPMVAVEGQLARRWAAELRRYDVRINGICVCGRGEPTAVGNLGRAVTFLAGSVGAGITGQTLMLDGGPASPGA